MRRVGAVAQPLVAVAGTTMIVLGLLFWSGNALDLVPLHMLLGLVLVVLLWSLAVTAAVAGAPPAQVAIAIGWGLLVPTLGITQDRILPGGAHWIVQVLHLLVGLAAIGQAMALAARIRQVPRRTAR
jgi:hypothetical protein